MNLDKYNPTSGGKFIIPLPKWVSDKKCVLTFKNKDKTCFFCSTQYNTYKMYEKEWLIEKIPDELNWDNAKPPSSNVDVDTFEENMKDKQQSTFIYVLDPEEGKESILFYRKTNVQKATHRISSGDGHHYRLWQIDEVKPPKDKTKKCLCFHCRHGFQSQELWKGCVAVEGRQIEMPTHDDIIVFKTFQKLKITLCRLWMFKPQNGNGFKQRV